MDLPWLKQLTTIWRNSESEGRAPHALLLLGPPGSGKRAAAAWIAARRLGIAAPDTEPRYPLAIPEHVDLYWTSPAEDKHTVGIDQIRALVGDLSLTSHAGGAKVAVIDPAQAMTANAANSLLKTLEEPPGDTLLVLIADRVGSLPATIFSRCQRMNVPLPAMTDSLAWLNRLQPSSDWPPVLEAAGNAPLEAVRLFERIADTEAMAQDFAALADRRALPLEVALRWSKMEPEFVLDWMCRQVQLCILRVFGGPGSRLAGKISDSVLQRIDRQNLFCYLDAINKLRGQPAGSYNLLLTLESLLIDWAVGLPKREL